MSFNTKHNPASSNGARVRTTRTMRHKHNTGVKVKRKSQKRSFVEPEGFNHGAKVKSQP